MKKLVIVLLFLSTLVPAVAEKRLLSGAMLLKKPVFLFVDGKDAVLEDLNGRELYREKNILAADMADGAGVAFLKRDSLVWMGDDLQPHKIKITGLLPVLGLVEQPVRLSLIEPGLVLVPERHPFILNTESAAKWQFPGCLLWEEGEVVFSGLRGVWAEGNWMLCRDGNALVLVNRGCMEKQLTLSLQHSDVANVWMEGKTVHVLLQNGAGYKVEPDAKKITAVARNRKDEPLLRQRFRFSGDEKDSIVELRLEDEGAFSLLSAWKKGRMKAIVSIRLPGEESEGYSLSFSMKTLGKFTFSLRRESGALILDFHEKDVIVTKEKGKIQFITVNEGQPYAVAGGVVYSWDSLRGTAKRCRLSERQD
ncbi:MAG: hypothetical protein DRJ14_05615 [Acidobacteria bacterium]|nr:MAG: hypothetical protein DRJ14_05615 [Acidobacteriota bacterium]